jgi:hypothetical protein
MQITILIRIWLNGCLKICKYNFSSFHIMYLIRFFSLKDEWINENDFNDTKEVDMSKLQQNNFSKYENQFYRGLRFRQNKRK